MTIRTLFASVAGMFLLLPGLSVAQTPKPALPPGAALTLELPSQISWRQGVRIPVVITNSVAEARNVSVASGPFVDPKGADPLQLDFCLAEKTSGACVTRLSLAADSQHSMWLVGAGSAKAGSYAGSVRLLAASGQQTSSAITLNVTTERWRIIGLIALGLGVALSFYMSVWIPHQRTRELAILPFARLAEQLEAVRGSIDKAAAPHTARQADELMAMLQPSWLQANQYIPSRWPSPTVATANADALKAHAQSVETRSNGIKLLASHIGAQAAPTTKAALDALANDPNFPQSDLQNRIATIIGGQPMLAAAPDGLTPAQIIFREDIRSLVYWLVSSILAVLLGFVLLVEGNPAFGGWDDAAAALLWALGIATTGTKLADLTVANLRAGLR